MVQKEYRLRAMELWFQNLPGSLLLGCEIDALRHYFYSSSGEHCVQIGGPSDLALIREANYSHKVYLNSQLLPAYSSIKMQSSFDSLPLRTGSIDAIVLAHLLEFSQNPEQLLQETYRVLVPSGRLVVLAFNPWSLWGMSRLIRKKTGFPWSGKFYSEYFLRKCLRQIGYKVVLNKTMYFQPVIDGKKQRSFYPFLESLGAVCFPHCGAVTLIMSIKEVIPLTLEKVPVRSKIEVGPVSLANEKVNFI